MSANIYPAARIDTFISESALRFRRALLVAVYQLCKETETSNVDAMLIVGFIKDSHVNTPTQLKKSLKGRIDTASIVKLTVLAQDIAAKRKKMEDLLGSQALHETLELAKCLINEETREVGVIRTWLHDVFNYACEIDAAKHRQLDTIINDAVESAVKAKLGKMPEWIELRDAERIGALKVYAQMGFAGLLGLCVYISHRKWAENSPSDITAIMTLCCSDKAAALTIPNENAIPKNVLLAFEGVTQKFNQWLFWIITSYAQRQFTVGGLTQPVVNQLQPAIGCISDESLRNTVANYVVTLSMERPQRKLAAPLSSAGLAGTFNW